MNLLAGWFRALRARLWWWRQARLFFALFALVLTAARLVDWPWTATVVDVTP